MSRLRAFHRLAAEAVRDSLRSRSGLAIFVSAALCLLFVERCSGATAIFEHGGRTIDPAVFSRVIGPLLYGLVALFLVAAAGLVACDVLARPIEDGTVSLWLARPVSRTLYALARLAGAVTLSGVVGAVVLLAATVLVTARYDLSYGPGLVGMAVFLADAVVVSAVAMAASLFLPRLLTLFLVVTWVQLVLFANLAHMVGAVFGGWLGALERWGPPLGTALLFALSPWVGLDADGGLALGVFLRLGLWAAGSVALVAFVFRRLELR